jgi:DNA end-binding protein Ku
VIRTTQHLAAVVVRDRALMLNTLRYPDELREASGLDLPAEGLKAAGVSPKEVELAKRLVDDMTEPWKPGEFKDTYHEDLMARIKEKIKQGQTKEITAPSKEGEERPRAQVIDLADLLKQSLARKGGAKPADRKAARRARSPHCAWCRRRAPRPRPQQAQARLTRSGGAGRSPWHWRNIGPSATSKSLPSRAARSSARPRVRCRS